MAPIVHSIEIDRSPEDVFAYFADLGTHGEWQQQIVSVHVDTDGLTRVGSRATDRRRLPGGTRDISYEITEHDPPRTIRRAGARSEASTAPSVRSGPSPSSRSTEARARS
jgi:uncharacterized membrane protein